MLAVGIIGLPNVGKSTLFNALTHGSAEVSNYPFTTIKENVGTVPVPDARLHQLERLLKPKEAVPSTVRFVDIAGLVRGASHGEGLGNQFLGGIRDVDALVHVVRCFHETDIAHVYGNVDPSRDIDIVETELLLADLEMINRAIEKRQRIWKTSPRQYADEEKRFRLYREQLTHGTPLRVLPLGTDQSRELKSLGLLSGKPVLYVANRSEVESSEEEAAVARLRQHRIAAGASTVVPISVRFEWELLQLSPEEQGEFLKEMGLEELAIAQLVREAFQLLNLITFFTTANEKLRAWEVENGSQAPEAAGKVHTDMEKGFVKAQVVHYENLLEHGSVQELHRLGLTRTEGKDYVVQDGDVIEFAFSS